MTSDIATVTHGPLDLSAENLSRSDSYGSHIDLRDSCLFNMSRFTLCSVFGALTLVEGYGGGGIRGGEYREG